MLVLLPFVFVFGLPHFEYYDTHGFVCVQCVSISFGYYYYF